MKKQKSATFSKKRLYISKRMIKTIAKLGTIVIILVNTANSICNLNLWYTSRNSSGSSQWIKL